MEAHYRVVDPFASLEAADDEDIKLFGQMIKDGPPSCSFVDPGQELTMWGYAFWWILLLNAHFALTDMCGHYRYADEWRGKDLTEKTENALYDVNMRPIFEQVKKDVENGVWRPLRPMERFAKA